jgi:23S rRNA-/tRNA-specific pseudouridylate synthase
VRVIQRCHLSLAGAAPIAVSLLAVRPRTGRTHQIRVHLSAAGHPCLGDPLYGHQEREQLPLRRQALHAFYLAVSHPRSGNRIGIVAPIAPDLEQLLALCGLDSDQIRAAVLNVGQGVGNPADNVKII